MGTCRMYIQKNNFKNELVILLIYTIYYKGNAVMVINTLKFKYL